MTTILIIIVTNDYMKNGNDNDGSNIDNDSNSSSNNHLNGNDDICRLATIEFNK